jgi:hypothetical protein
LWHYNITPAIGNMEPVNSDFHTPKNFSEKYPQFGHTHSKKILQPCPRTKKYKNIDFTGAKSLACPRALNC